MTAFSELLEKHMYAAGVEEIWVLLARVAEVMEEGVPPLTAQTLGAYRHGDAQIDACPAHFRALAKALWLSEDEAIVLAYAYIYDEVPNPSVVARVVHERVGEE